MTSPEILPTLQPTPQPTPQPAPHPTLARLEMLATSVGGDPGVLAVLGLGSAGAEHQRFDDHSDIDFFLVVDGVDGVAAQRRYLADVGWLEGFGGRLAFSYVNDPHGRKALFDDGLFLEYAVLTGAELAGLPFAGERVVWARDGDRLAALLDQRPGLAAPASVDTVHFHVHEALTNLLVGLHREERGEHLTGSRFIQVYAVDRVLALLRLDGRAWDRRDPFDATRRVESSVAADELPLADLLPGHLGNRRAAAALLGWLTSHYDPDPALVAAVRDRLEAQ